MSDDFKAFDRRSVLKSIGTAAVVGAGFSATTTSAAAEEADQIARNYADEDRLRFALEQHGEGLRQTLVDEGFVSEDFDFWSLDFDIDPNETGLSPKARDRLASVSGVVEDGVPTAFGVVSTSSATHDISLFVQPERDEAYAMVEPKGSDDRFMVSDSGITPQGCAYTECQDDCCSTSSRTRYTYNCDSNCENCSLYDTDCMCDC